MSKKNKNRQQSLLRDSSKNENSVISTNEMEAIKTENAAGSNAANSGLSASLRTHWWAVALVAFLAVGALGSTLKYLEDSARQNAASGNNPNGGSEQSALAKLNPFAPAAMPSVSPTPLPLSKEYIYAGSRLLAVEDANASAAPPADLAIFRPSSGGWWVLNASGQGYTSQVWGGNAGDVPVPGDFDGDGKTDFSIFRPSDGSWQVLQSSNSAYYGFQFGVSTDKTAQADYDGDGKTDLAVYRIDQNNLGVWYIRRSSDAGVVIQQFGLPSDTPAPADYDGDGQADIGVWRSSNQTFYSIGSSTNTVQTVLLGQSGATVVSGDYDGDGKADYAVRNGASWHIRNSAGGTVQTVTPPGDLASDIAAQNDYDGDGRVDVAVWRGSNGTWYIRKSGAGGSLRQEQWGQSGDIPVPAFYRR